MSKSSNFEKNKHTISKLIQRRGEEKKKKKKNREGNEKKTRN